MQPAAAARRERDWTLLAAGAVAALTLWRLALLPHAAIDLFVDDAQYWLWGREPAWGYYSKPPLIGWILGLSTRLGGDGAFWIRAPLPLLHGATALVLMALGTRLFDRRVGALAAVAYASLPAVSLGSAMVSTDTPLMLAFATAILAWSHLAERRSRGWALGLGAAIGLGLLAKYAMAYVLPAAALAALLLPGARIAPRDAALAAGLAAALIAPNLAWNLGHDLATLRHTADNAGWSGLALDPRPLAAFLAAQFAVMGPVLFGAYLLAVLAVLRGRGGPALAYLVAFSLPVLVLVCGQALINRAYANWAAATYAGGTIAAVAVLAARPRWLALGLGINLALALLFPLALMRAETLAIGERLLFERSLGRHAVSERALAVARAEGLDTIVARERAHLADLFYTLRDAGLAIHAEPHDGPPRNHYEQRHTLPAGATGPVLFLAAGGAGPACRDAGAPVAERVRWVPDRGFARGRELRLYRVDAACWAAEAP